MSYQHINRFSSDLETTFATDQSETWRDQRLVEGSVDISGLDQPPIPDMTVVDRLHASNQPVFGSQFGSSFKAGMYIDGLSTGLATGVTYTAPQNNIQEILQACMGGGYGHQGTLVSDSEGSSTVLTIYVTAGTGAGGYFLCGSGVIILGQLRWVTNGAANNIVLNMALAAIPPNATPVYNCVTIYLDEDTFGTDAYSLVLRLLGKESGDQWIARGCVGKFTLEMGLRKLLQANFEFGVTAWEKSSGHTLTGATYTGAGPLAIKNRYLYYQTVGTTTRNLLSLDTLSMDPGLSYQAEESGDGINQTLRWRQLRNEAKFSFEAHGFRNYDEFWTSFAAEQAKQILVQIGNTPRVGGAGTGVVGFRLPNCYFARQPQRKIVGPMVKVGCDFVTDEQPSPASISNIAYSRAAIFLG